ncbi:cGMP-dependent protein kinase, isozyme 1-like [Anthonomus grandis grandis]|uniref:cGMP-dependent protein kinase, isozyme 1-like n=1 Tax=Anthonomus grandis grandis TaxID=2921223 RepID=UPI002166B8AE|nr:cGMP-dependent protein kinase, isozyme 1-like [Anthonomus grandis grandis]
MFCLHKTTHKATITKVRFTEDPIPFKPEKNTKPVLSHGESNRRKAFHSNPVETNKNQKIECYPKSESDEKIIKKALEENDFLKKVMSEDNVQLIVQAMQLKTVKPNEVIIKQGDKGNAIYISSKGTFEVIVNGETKVTFTDQRVFGELALINDAKRLSTVKALSEGAIWCLDRKTYQLIVALNNSNKEEDLFQFLQTVDKLNSKGADTLRVVANLLREAFFEADSKIVREGDPGQLFYIIRAGSVTVSKVNEGIIGKLHKGDCFGELALQNEDIRQATVTAEAPGVDCLTLNRFDFQNYFGDIKITDISVQKLKSINEVQPEYMDLPLKDLTILGILGTGGFGRVELAQSKKKKQLVFALKRIAKFTIVLEEKQQHAYNEKYIQLNSVSPFIIRLYRTYKTKKYIYFLMEPCLGGDLFGLLHRQKKLRFTNEETRFIVACVMEALFYLHVRGIIFRDLKPENVLVASNGYFKLADFGCAKKLDIDGARTYTFIGTIEYSTPEVIKGKGHNRAVDYWALGILIYELLVGRSPFFNDGPDYNKTFEKILKGIAFVKFPEHFDGCARTLVQKFCKPNPWNRLGMSKDGIAKIRGDKWFSDFNWTDLAECRMYSPFVPTLKGPTDLSHFPRQQRSSRPEPPDELSGWDKDL